MKNLLFGLTPQPSASADRLRRSAPPLKIRGGRGRYDRQKGVTLIELLVVLSIVVILMVVLAFTYQGWQGKYNVESQVKQLYSDMVSARTRAMQMGTSCFLDFPSTTQYEMRDDANGDNILNAGDNLINSTYPKTVGSGYTLNWSNGANPADISLVNAVMTFNNRGLITYYDKTGTVTPAVPPTPVTIGLTWAGATAKPDYNCIIVNQTMINTGQLACSNSPDPNNPVVCGSDADCPSGVAGSCSICQEK